LSISNPINITLKE